MVHPSRRGGRVGAGLVGALEGEAVARGCRGAHVQTSSEAARGFYERIGYRTMLTMKEAEPGFARHTLQKRFPGDLPPPVDDWRFGPEDVAAT